MSKTLLPALAATLFVVSLSPVYSFDYERFSPPTPTSIDSSSAKDDIQHFAAQDTFELAPSGRINKVLIENDLNTGRLEPTRKSPQTSNFGKQYALLNHIDFPNITYSLSLDSEGSTAECGPSPMTAAQIEAVVGRTAQSYGIDPSLAKAIAWTESRYDRNRNSPQGARGPMQLMPATATGLGVVDVCDPVANIDGGIRHLKRMLEEFQNPILAAAAYNAGAQAVYDSGGVPPFGETVRYVAAVLNHQMGLQMPGKSQARETAAGDASPSANEIASDVIGARGSRFIKGVMQF
ncbi:lytic transglycosylase domain-containing protein [Agrobacterium fabrum]|uniref:lytic transglycosylase domain-containing protein n=1 Tax=Agrobacterium fabrum TaxID=1176649 RepID=UPI003BA0B9CC